MVYFVCNSCQQSLKTPAVAKHYCNAMLSCVDCSKDFSPDPSASNSYKTHSVCISEAEKYQGALFKGGKKGKKIDPQELWIESVSKAAAAAGPKFKTVLERLVGYPNVPRKLKPFLNFAKNSIGVRDDAVLNEMFNQIQAQMPPKEGAGGAAGGAGKEEEEKEEEKPAAPALAPAAAKEEKKDKKEKKEKKEKEAEEPAAEERVSGKKRSREEQSKSEDSSKPAAGGAGAAPAEEDKDEGSGSLKKHILSALSSAEGGDMKVKKLQKAVLKEAGAAAGESEEAAEAAFAKQLQKLVKKGKVTLEEDGKRAILAGKA